MDERTPLINPSALPTRTPSEGCMWSRNVVALMGFLGFANVYAMRVNLSVAMVAMVNNNITNNINITQSCPGPGSLNSTTPQEGIT